MNVPIDYDEEKERTNNGSDITGLLKHKTDKKFENEKSIRVRFKKTKTTINEQSNMSKYCRSVLGDVINKPAEIQRDWVSFSI